MGDLVYLTSRRWAGERARGVVTGLEKSRKIMISACLCYCNNTWGRDTRSWRLERVPIVVGFQGPT